METTVIIRGTKGAALFFDDSDRQTFRWACSLLPSRLADNLRTLERCGVVHAIQFTSDREAVLRLEPVEWTAHRCAQLLVKVYDAYFRRRYRRSGHQVEYVIKE